jgi:prolipoprotein diacylglyceryltransferase
MRKPRLDWLKLAFVISFFAVGIPYWLVPYNQVNLPSTLLGPELFVVAIVTLIVQAKAIRPFWKTVRIIGAAFAAAVLARVIVEGLRDPSSHNLWPFEVVIALVVGFLCAILGASLGLLVARIRKRSPSPSHPN